MTAFIQTQRQRLQQGELKADLIAPHGDAKALEAAVWTVAARAVFNLDEFITKG